MQEGQFRRETPAEMVQIRFALRAGVWRTVCVFGAAALFEHLKWLCAEAFVIDPARGRLRGNKGKGVRDMERAAVHSRTAQRENVMSRNSWKREVFTETQELGIYDGAPPFHFNATDGVFPLEGYLEDDYNWTSAAAAIRAFSGRAGFAQNTVLRSCGLLRGWGLPRQAREACPCFRLTIALSSDWPWEVCALQCFAFRALCLRHVYEKWTKVDIDASPLEGCRRDRTH